MTAAKEKLLAWLSTSRRSSQTLSKVFIFLNLRKRKVKVKNWKGDVYKGMSKMTKKEFARNMQK